MPERKDTDVHKPDGTIFQGDKIGHVDKESHIRRRDGLIFKGDEIGYVDRNKNIRRPDGIILKGDVVGKIKGIAAYAKDGLILSGEQWGYVDDDGNIRQRDGIIFRGRIIGKMRGHNKEAQTSLRSPQYLEIHPTQAHCGQFLLDVPPQEIVTGQKGAPFGRKYQSVVTDVDAQRAPRLDIIRKFRWNRRFSSAPVGSWVAEAAAVYSLDNLNLCALDPSPPERQELARAHAHQACESIYNPIPETQNRETQVVLFLRHGAFLSPLCCLRRHQ